MSKREWGEKYNVTMIMLLRLFYSNFINVSPNFAPYLNLTVRKSRTMNEKITILTGELACANI